MAAKNILRNHFIGNQRITITTWATTEPNNVVVAFEASIAGAFTFTKRSSTNYTAYKFQIALILTH